MDRAALKCNQNNKLQEKVAISRDLAVLERQDMSDVVLDEEVCGIRFRCFVIIGSKGSREDLLRMVLVILLPN